eukprot:2207091-Rhodomonas_salina.5
MVVSSVWVPLTSATTILVLYVVDVVLHIAFHPDNEWNELVKNIYAGSVHEHPQSPSVVRRKTAEIKCRKRRQISWLNVH